MQSCGEDLNEIICKRHSAQCLTQTGHSVSIFYNHTAFSRRIISVFSARAQVKSSGGAYRIWLSPGVWWHQPLYWEQLLLSGVVFCPKLFNRPPSGQEADLAVFNSVRTAGPNSLAPGTGFVKENFSTGLGWFQDDSGTLNFCTWFLLLFHCNI